MSNRCKEDCTRWDDRFTSISCSYCKRKPAGMADNYEPKEPEEPKLPDKMGEVVEGLSDTGLVGKHNRYKINQIIDYLAAMRGEK